MPRSTAAPKAPQGWWNRRGPPALHPGVGELPARGIARWRIATETAPPADHEPGHPPRPTRAMMTARAATTRPRAPARRGPTRLSASRQPRRSKTRVGW